MSLVYTTSVPGFRSKLSITFDYRVCLLTHSIVMFLSRSAIIDLSVLHGKQLGSECQCPIFFPDCATPTSRPTVWCVL